MIDLHETFDGWLEKVEGDKTAAAVMTLAEVVGEIAHTIDRAMGDDELLFNVLVNAGREIGREKQTAKELTQ